MDIKVIITGATGMVGEGVLMECLLHPSVTAVLSVSRKPSGKSHPKLKEYIVPDFLDLQHDDEKLKGYDACFFCAGISSVGRKEEEYTRITYDTTVHFAKVLAAQSREMTFIYVSGASTDSTEKGRIMWARVKGKTENDLAKLPFAQVHNFRPGFMQATPGQQNLLPLYKYIGWTFPFFKMIMPNKVSTLKQVGLAMINSVLTRGGKTVMEVKDINLMSTVAS